MTEQRLNELIQDLKAFGEFDAGERGFNHVARIGSLVEEARKAQRMKRQLETAAAQLSIAKEALAHYQLNYYIDGTAQQALNRIREMEGRK